MCEIIKFEIQGNKLLDCRNFDAVYIDPSYHKDVIVHPKKLLIKPLKGIRVLSSGNLYTIIGCERELPENETIESLGGIDKCKDKWRYFIKCVPSFADIDCLEKIE